MPRAARRGRRAAKAKAKARAAVAGAAVDRAEENRADRSILGDSAVSHAESISADEEERKHALWNGIHAMVLVVLVIAYGWTIALLDGDREMLSAAWREILGELTPDEPKNAERITEGEVVPKWAEFLHADDVTKQLNWFQTFCKVKHGMDDHLEFFWTCNIINVDIDYPEDTQPLSPGMNCSRAFVRNHIIKGDDPRCVPWGSESLELLQNLESSFYDYDSKVGSVDEVYDEYTVREGNPMWETVDEGFEEVDSRLKDIEELIGASGSRRLPETGLGLHECPSDMRCPWRNVNDDREIEDVPCDCFDFGKLSNGSDFWKSKRTCRNHHWGLIHLCRPNQIAVKFYIERVMMRKVLKRIERRQRVLWFMVEMRFTDIQGGNLDGAPSGWYRTYLNLQEGEFYGYKTLGEGIMGALTVLMLFCVFVIEVVCTALRFPWSLRRILALRDPAVVNERLLAEDEEWGHVATPSLDDVRWLFEESLLQLVDGRGARREYMQMNLIVMENIITVIIILGWLSSFSDWDKSFIPQEYDTSEKYSPREYIMEHMEGEQQLTELIFEIFFDDTTWHGLAWILLYFRTMFYFLRLFPGLRWIPISLTLASVRVMYFLLAYGFLILGFGLLAYIQFGQRFVQFSSLTRACYELFFLTCGVPGYVFDDLYPFEDNGSWLACAFLAAFVVVSVTLGLNFFTTIILDAYNISTNPDAAEKVLEESWNTICDMLMLSLGIPLELYWDDADGREDGDAGHESRSVAAEMELQTASETVQGTSSIEMPNVTKVSTVHW